MQKVKRGGVVIVGLLLRADVSVWGENDWSTLDIWWLLVWGKNVGIFDVGGGW